MENVYLAKLIASDYDIEFFKTEEEARAWAKKENDIFKAEYHSEEVYYKDPNSKEWIVCPLSEELNELEYNEDVADYQRFLKCLAFNGFN